MNKTRVHELAQKMGIDNKELIARLKAIGVEVKNHLAIIDDDTVNKIIAPMQSKDVSQDEVRVKPTVIRRRAKIVEEPIAEAPEEEKVSEPGEIIPEAPVAAEATAAEKKEPVEVITKPSVEEEQEVLPSWTGRGLCGYRSKGRFLDIGTPEAYTAAGQFFASQRLA